MTNTDIPENEARFELRCRLGLPQLRTTADVCGVSLYLGDFRARSLRETRKVDFIKTLAMRFPQIRRTFTVSLGRIEGFEP